MTGIIVLLVAAAAVCEASLIPLSTSWPTQTTCSRAMSSGLTYMPSSGTLDYSQLYQSLYPEANMNSQMTVNPLEDMSMTYLSGMPQMGSSFEMTDLLRTMSPAMRGSSRLMLPGRELGLNPYRGSLRSGMRDDYRMGGGFRDRGCDDYCDERCRDCDDRCMDDCCDRCQQRCNSECMNYGQQRCNSECGNRCQQRCNSECGNCCDCGDCNSNCGSSGCCNSMSRCSSRSGCNSNRCGSSGSCGPRNMQRSPCRNMQGQSCCNSLC